jgi:intein/homing endonuclease
MDSFPGDTMVHVRAVDAVANDAQRGVTTLKPISQLKVGDEVLSLAEWKDAGKERGVDQRLSYEKVQELKITHQRQRTMVDLKLDNGQTLTATDGHPFNTPEGWRDAALLKSGDKVLLKEGITGLNLREVTILKATHRAELLTTYNLEVANAHTFFVGEEGLLVHNGCNYEKVGKYKVLKKPEAHNGGKEHVHWGEKNARENAVSIDGKERHGEAPPQKVKDYINEKFGWNL